MGVDPDLVAGAGGLRSASDEEDGAAFGGAGGLGADAVGEGAAGGAAVEEDQEAVIQREPVQVGVKLGEAACAGSGGTRSVRSSFQTSVRHPGGSMPIMPCCSL